MTETIPSDPAGLREYVREKNDSPPPPAVRDEPPVIDYSESPEPKESVTLKKAADDFAERRRKRLEGEAQELQAYGINAHAN